MRKYKLIIQEEFNYYDGFRFAYDSIVGTILSFDLVFQAEVWEKYKEINHFTDEQTREALLKNERDEELGEDEDKLINACEFLNISLSDNNLVLTEYGYGDTITSKRGWFTSDLIGFLEELGYEIRFEGESWKFETNGVFYLE